MMADSQDAGSPAAMPAPLAARNSALTPTGEAIAGKPLREVRPSLRTSGVQQGFAQRQERDPFAVRRAAPGDDPRSGSDRIGELA